MISRLSWPAVTLSLGDVMMGLKGMRVKDNDPNADLSRLHIEHYGGPSNGSLVEKAGESTRYGQELCVPHNSPLRIQRGLPAGEERLSRPHGIPGVRRGGALLPSRFYR